MYGSLVHKNLIPFTIWAWHVSVKGRACFGGPYLCLDPGHSLLDFLGCTVDSLHMFGLQASTVPPHLSTRVVIGILSVITVGTQVA